MSARELVSPKSTFLDIVDARYGEPLKVLLERGKRLFGLGARTLKRIIYNEQPSERSLLQFYSRAAERKYALAAALEVAFPDDRESIAKVRFLAGQYAIRARALGAAVVEW